MFSIRERERRRNLREKEEREEKEILRRLLEEKEANHAHKESIKQTESCLFSFLFLIGITFFFISKFI